MFLDKYHHYKEVIHCSLTPAQARQKIYDADRSRKYPLNIEFDKEVLQVAYKPFLPTRAPQPAVMVRIVPTADGCDLHCSRFRHQFFVTYFICIIIAIVFLGNLFIKWEWQPFRLLLFLLLPILAMLLYQYHVSMQQKYDARIVNTLLDIFNEETASIK